MEILPVHECIMRTLTGAVCVESWRKKLGWRGNEGRLGDGNGETSEFRQFFSDILLRRDAEKWGGY